MGWVGPCLYCSMLLVLFKHAKPRCELHLISEKLPSMDEVQAAVLQLRVLFSDLRWFDNIFFRKKWNA